MQKFKLIGETIKESGKTVGRIFGQNIKDASGKTIGRINNDRIRDYSGKTIGQLINSNLKDASGRTLIRIDQIYKAIDGEAEDIILAAIWLLFVRKQ